MYISKDNLEVQADLKNIKNNQVASVHWRIATSYMHTYPLKTDLAKLGFSWKDRLLL
jgi:hypothetical protein